MRSRRSSRSLVGRHRLARDSRLSARLLSGRMSSVRVEGSRHSGWSGKGGRRRTRVSRLSAKLLEGQGRDKSQSGSYKCPGRATSCHSGLGVRDPAGSHELAYLLESGATVVDVLLSSATARRTLAFDSPGEADILSIVLGNLNFLPVHHGRQRSKVRVTEATG